MPERIVKPTFVSRIAYKDQGAAVEWLKKAFGFKTISLATDAAGKVIHAEMAFGNGMIVIGSEWENIKAPMSVGGANTQTISANLESGIEAHCEKSRAAGGVIIQEPQEQFHGDRTYRVRDPEGHVWSFSQKIREVPTAELEAAIPGMKVWRS
jgi:uncharacterized glyoxalase superfamily protein PhnB